MSFINIAIDKHRLTHTSVTNNPQPSSLAADQPHPTRIQQSRDNFTMADAAVENPANTVPPHKKQLPSSIPNFDTLEGFSTEGSDDYSTFKKLQRQLECV